MRIGVPTGAGLRMAVYRIDDAGRHHGVAHLAVGIVAPPSLAEIPCRCRQCAPAAPATPSLFDLIEGEA